MSIETKTAIPNYSDIDGKATQYIKLVLTIANIENAAKSSSDIVKIVKEKALSIKNKNAMSLRKSKYPKDKATTFLPFAEINCTSKQVNVSKGKLYNYWWIEPNTKPIKLLKGEIPEQLKGKDLSSLGNF